MLSPSISGNRESWAVLSLAGVRFCHGRAENDSCGRGSRNRSALGLRVHLMLLLRYEDAGARRALGRACTCYCVQVRRRSRCVPVRPARGISVRGRLELLLLFYLGEAALRPVAGHSAFCPPTHPLFRTPVRLVALADSQLLLLDALVHTCEAWPGASMRGSGRHAAWHAKLAWRERARLGTPGWQAQLTWRERARLGSPGCTPYRKLARGQIPHCCSLSFSGNRES